MNKLLTYAGTQPVYLGDINFMQNAAADMFKSLAKALMNMPSDTMNAILQGVDISYPEVGTIAWTAGVVVLNGEILPVAAGTISGSDEDDLYFHVVSVLSGSRTFKNLDVHDCYDTRSAVLSLTSTDGIAYSSMKRLHNYNEDQEYEAATLVGNLTAASLKAKNGLFLFKGTFDCNTGLPASSSAIGTAMFRIYPFSEETIYQENYFTSIIYIKDSDSTAVVLPVRLQITVVHVGAEADVLTIQIFCPARAESLSAGSGSFFIFLPVF